MTDLPDLGHLHDDADLLRSHPLPCPSELVGSDPDMAADVELAVPEYIEELSQIGTSSCTGFATGNGVDLIALDRGMRLPPISRLAPYTDARWPVLVDGGARPRDVITSLQVRGVVAETRWPFSKERVNEPLPWDFYQHGVDARIDGIYRFTVEGDDLEELACLTLTKRHPITFATEVDAAYDGYEAGQVLDAPTGKVRGRHYNCIYGFVRVGGRGLFKVMNQWFGAGGWTKARNRYLMTGARLRAGVDLYTFTIAPTAGSVS